MHLEHLKMHEFSGSMTPVTSLQTGINGDSEGEEGMGRFTTLPVCDFLIV